MKETELLTIVGYLELLKHCEKKIKKINRLIF